MMYATSQNNDIEFTTIEIERNRFNPKQLDQMEEFIQKLPEIDPSASIIENERAFVITAKKHMLIETSLEFAKYYVVHLGITIYESEKGIGSSIMYNSASVEEQQRLQHRRVLPETIISFHSTNSALSRGAVVICEKNYTKLMSTVGRASDLKESSESEKSVTRVTSWKPGYFAKKLATKMQETSHGESRLSITKSI